MTLQQMTRWERWKDILKFAWPLIIANSFWNLQLTIDRVFLGNYSTAALGAAIAVMGIFWTPMALLQQTAAYLTTFVAQYFGAQQMEKIGPAFWQAVIVSVVGGLLFLGLIPLADSLFDFLGHAEDLRVLEKEYFVALCYSAMPTALAAVASSFFTGLGRTKVILVLNFVGLVANVVLDYLMIFGKFGFPALGVAGAGYATALATWVSALVGLALVARTEPRRYHMNVWRYQHDLMKRFIRYGLPSGLQWALEGLAFSVFLVIIGRATDGSAALASSSIVVTVMMLAILPTLGVGQAVGVRVGQHIGERNVALAERDTWSGIQVSFLYILLVALTFVLVPEFYLSWFRNSQSDALWSQVSVLVPHLLMFVAAFTSFDSLNIVLSFALKGAGDTRFVSLVALLVPWPLMVIPTWLMKDWPHGVYWAWGAASVYIVSLAMIFLWRFRQGRWKSMNVIGLGPPSHEA